MATTITYDGLGSRADLTDGAGVVTDTYSYDVLEAEVLIEDWRIEYNTRRPHSSLGWLAPATYADRWRAEQPAGLS